ncbi:hypothetical protein DFH07DRAFT_313296 [Mycena maculata]|uniref:Uncharacterized protein n=1 Tax=Mycena maculata TaxID=230809 RepID=A0AAD7JME2_9AGAR|nr:hypothetical protein DFH07DRAFT_313296 [Mycena maculata]
MRAHSCWMIFRSRTLARTRWSLSHRICAVQLLTRGSNLTNRSIYRIQGRVVKVESRPVCNDGLPRACLIDSWRIFFHKLGPPAGWPLSLRMERRSPV